MSEEQSKRICFVIAPISSPGTDIRRRSDQVLKHIITPALDGLGYEIVRADMISEPGIITSQIIQHILEDDLVIADLTGKNPNVFYELAIRHMVRKPVIQISQSGETIPFDVAASRVIQFDHRDLDSAAECRGGIRAQAKAIANDPNLVNSPISAAIDLESVRQSENPLAASIIEMSSRLGSLEAAISSSQDRPGLTVKSTEHDRRELMHNRALLEQVNRQLASLYSSELYVPQFDRVPQMVVTAEQAQKYGLTEDDPLP